MDKVRVAIDECGDLEIYSGPLRLCAISDSPDSKREVVWTPQVSRQVGVNREGLAAALHRAADWLMIE